MLHQGLALAIAAFTFLQLLRGKWPRHVLTLAAGGLMVVVVLLGVMGSLDAVMEALSVDSFGKPQFWFAHGGVTERNVGINWSTVLFLVGMMVMVEGMSEAGFFDWLCLRLAKSLGFRPMPLLLSFMAVAALLSMFVDSITVVLFLVVATVRLARLLRIDPVPMIIGEIFAANLGGAATMTGDPPNIILGTSLGLGFWDFLQNNGPICLVGFGVALGYFYLCFRNKLRAGAWSVDPALWAMEPGDAIPNRRAFGVNVAIFGGMILLLATHAWTGLTMPTIGVVAAGGLADHRVHHRPFPGGQRAGADRHPGRPGPLPREPGRGGHGPDDGGPDLVHRPAVRLCGQHPHGHGDGPRSDGPVRRPGDGPGNPHLERVQRDGHRGDCHPHRGLGQRHRRHAGRPRGAPHLLAAVL